MPVPLPDSPTGGRAGELAGNGTKLQMLAGRYELNSLLVSPVGVPSSYLGSTARLG